MSDLQLVNQSITNTGTIDPGLESQLQFSSSLKPLRNKLGWCDACSKLPPEGTRFSACSGCRAVLYCSKECQRIRWPEHKYVHPVSCLLVAFTAPKMALQEVSVASTQRGDLTEHTCTKRQPLSSAAELSAAQHADSRLPDGAWIDLQERHRHDRVRIQAHAWKNDRS